MQTLFQLRQLASIMGARLLTRWFATIPLALLSAVAEGGGATLIFWTMKLFSSPDAASPPGLAGEWMSKLPMKDSTTLTLLLIASFAGLYVFKNIVLGVAVYLQGLVVAETNTELSSRLLSHYLTMPYERHTTEGSSQMMRNLLDSVQYACDAAGSTMGLISNALLAVAIFTVLAVASPGATFLVAVFLFCVFFLIVRTTQRFFRGWGLKSRALSADVIKVLQEIFEGIREIKLFAKERHFFDIYVTHKTKHARIRHLNSTFAAVPRLISEGVFVCAGLTAIGFILWSDGTNDRVALISLYAYAGFRLLPLTNGAITRLNRIQFGLASVEHLYRDLEGMPGTPQGTTSPDVQRLELKTGIEIESINYRYEGASDATLEGVSLRIPVASTLGLAGASGAGKSTLVNLIVGLLHAQDGDILIDNRPITDCLHAWQRCIGYVPQTITVLDDTLRGNIAFGVPKAEIDDDRVAEVVNIAQISDFVAALPDGVDTSLGEHGVRLSGGERQRIAVARALYDKPSVLILDEATAGLDRETEEALLRALIDEESLCLRIFVSHRPSTLAYCNHLAVLVGGRLEAAGDVDEVVHSCEAFRALIGGSLIARPERPE